MVSPLVYQRDHPDRVTPEMIAKGILKCAQIGERDVAPGPSRATDRIA